MMMLAQHTQLPFGRAAAAVPHPVVVTALAYMREALQREEYEALPGMAQIAREFGLSEERLAALFHPRA